MRLDYDDDVLDIMDKVNATLADHGFKFVDDEMEHDGYMMYDLLIGPVTTDD